MNNAEMHEWACDVLATPEIHSISELSNALDTIEECRRNVYGPQPVPNSTDKRSDEG